MPRCSRTDIHEAGLQARFIGDDRVAPLATDIPTEDAADRIVQAAIDSFGQLDIAINAPGIFKLLPFDVLGV